MKDKNMIINEVMSNENFVPNRQYLIVDCMGHVDNHQFITESFKPINGGRVKFSGPFTECERPNKNGRIYRREVLVPEFDKLAKLCQTGQVLGEVDHPQDSVIHLCNAGFQITSL